METILIIFGILFVIAFFFLAFILAEGLSQIHHDIRLIFSCLNKSHDDIHKALDRIADRLCAEGIWQKDRHAVVVKNIADQDKKEAIFEEIYNFTPMFSIYHNDLNSLPIVVFEGSFKRAKELCDVLESYSVTTEIFKLTPGVESQLKRGKTFLYDEIV